MTDESLEKVCSLVKASMGIENIQVDNKIATYDPAEQEESTIAAAVIVAESAESQENI
jgi:hypothetical protein